MTASARATVTGTASSIGTPALLASAPTSAATRALAVTSSPSLTLMEVSGWSGELTPPLPLLLPRVLQRVADPMDGAHPAGPDLGAQRTDVAVDGAGPGRVRPVPDLGQQVLAGEHLAGRGRQPRQQVELGRREPHLLLGHGHPSRAGVDHEVTHDETGRGPGGELGGAVDAAQEGADPGHQLAHPERLGEVVVGTDREPDQHVGLVVPRGQHQHRHRLGRLDAAADLVPVEAGQHHVQHDQLGVDLGGRATAPGPSYAWSTWKPSARSRSATASLITGSSSTTRTRRGSMS